MSLCIRELTDQFEIQGAYHIKMWRDKISKCETLAAGEDFEYEKWDIDEDILEREITYMYVMDGVLNIELEEPEED